MGKRGRKGLPEAVKAQMAHLYRNNSTMREIAKLHGCSVTTVRRILSEKGEPARGRGRRKGVTFKKVVDTSEAPVKKLTVKEVDEEKKTVTFDVEPSEPVEKPVLTF
jgi:transposase-like protein